MNNQETPGVNDRIRQAGQGTGTTVKVQAVVSLKADYPLPVLLDVAGLARSTFFYHQARLQAPDPQEKLKAAVTKIFTTNHAGTGTAAFTPNW